MTPGETFMLLLVTIFLTLGLLMAAVRSPGGFKLGGAKSTYIPTSTYTPLPVKTTKCTYCNGRGVVKCLLCNGRGGSYSEYYYDYLDKTTWKSCFFCNGTGVNTCSLCQGKGYR